MSKREKTIVASVEDADELGNILEGTNIRYASSVAPSSPAKEQPNTGRARRERARRGSSSPITTSIVTDSDSTVHPRRDGLKKPSRDREKSLSGSSKKAIMAASRPPVKHAKTTPSISRRDNESSYYGVEPTVTPAATRPRAQSRPSSYYAAQSRPPPSNSRFYANQTPGPSLPTSFPPPSWGPGPGPMPSPFGPPSPAPLVMQQPPPPPPQSDYFARPLESRFGGSARPQSSMGFRPPRAIEYDDYEDHERQLARRPSTTRKVSKNEDDRKAMPPPPRRPASARPTALAFRPPPSTPSRRTVDYDDDPDAEESLFRDLSPLAPLAPVGSYEYTSPLAFRPRPGFGAGMGYDPSDYHTEVAGTGRRNSYYGGNSASSGSAYEDKVRLASRYQDDIIGGPQMPLTAETLRKAGRSGASSRSTRSSGSHDESDYRQSATTRTTRSTAPNDEDVTIRVKGSTTLKFGNAEMQCQDGAEINISSRNGNTEIRTADSDARSSFIDQDDRRTRVDIPQSRARATSRAKSRPRSFSRPISKYDATPKYDSGLRYEVGTKYDYAPEYDTYSSYVPPPPLPPPYPEYPSSYSSRHGDGFYGPPM
ncbi:hypothetical protein C8A00DRAFT_18068 [Chaetomidium leptoderma]|uniref:Uncharacterized protein n=1 Tax=Chaetomidium leptoderma TaxID=669021 RepID=A0AAN6ZUB6_9PEZI|nr:hypothetical protein C8A00DRAFT_18068 [Chaetomidium leptoderma]